MHHKKIITFSIIFFISICIIKVNAQESNIVGDTIFVNAEAEIQIKFPTRPNSFSTEPINAPYSLRSEESSVIITGRLENSKPATLIVSEGGRTHHFKLVFKKDINYNNEAALFKDYGTEKKLKEHILAKANQATSQPEEKATVITQGSKVPDKDNLAQQDIDRKYIALTDQAKLYIDQKKYVQAGEKYKQALELKPKDLYAIHQLEVISSLKREENAKKVQQQSEDLYKNYVALGEKAFTKNQLTEARSNFELALTYRTDDALATSRLKSIDEKEKAQKENTDLENTYNSAIQLANTLFQAGDLEGAKIEYTRANGYIRRQLPLDQIKKIDKLLAQKAEKDNIEKQKEGERLIVEKQEKEKQERENNYAAAVQSADVFFKAGDYDNATIEYNKALDFIKKDWPRDQINQINKIKADRLAQQDIARKEKEQQELEDKYNVAMQAGEKYFGESDYANAKIMYNRAFSLIPKSLPQEKIKEINKIITDGIAQENEEKQRLAREAEITSRFTTLIKNADTEFDKKNYIKARQLYSLASNLKPSEAYPKDRLGTVENIFAKIASDSKARNDSFALANETNQKYNLALVHAKSSYKKNDLLNAKIFYEEAMNLKPLDNESKNQLNLITGKLADIAKDNETNSTYTQNIALADSQLILKLYEAALNNYNAALKLKPSESYSKAQIKFIQSELANEEKRKEIIKNQESEQSYTDELKEADKLVADKKYEEAKSLYTHALTIHPENATAKRRLEILSYQIEKRRADSLGKVSIAVADPPVESKRKKSRTQNKNIVSESLEKPADNHLAIQEGPMPYSSEELKSKYPGIDFLNLPPEQPFNKLAVSSKDDLNIYDKLLLEKPRLDLFSDDQGIKLIVEGINFEETTCYIKVLIQNKSNVDFLTGAMMLTWTKKTGNHIKLYPNHLYPSPLPVIRPDYEASVIYVCKTYSILDADFLTFELIDRLKKITIHVNIPGSVYNQEWVRYE